MTDLLAGLEQCPFCDGPPELVEHRIPLISRALFYYRCSDEDCQGCASPLTKYAGRSDAAAHWNKRIVKEHLAKHDNLTIPAAKLDNEPEQAVDSLAAIEQRLALPHGGGG